ncbi:hypothetical protein CANCADRAFT_111455 [Tortispora caseinolytica NRRL Y-17796]|uniref:Translationally-controlled tumor protein homolog n=1 Tax=Tortispora caseinolytica NRRL Y-17796 TaxID=767744 RepID=A0A1E4TGE4_9ASCO|nr:hypothetical protein CANCADRAFT_111455 [Tortispora caseinolytica NRRL Y-17796]
MLLYKDAVSGDELISDAYDLKLVDDVVYEVDCQTVQIKEGDVDIGANPSAEEGGDDVDDSVQTVINVVHSFRLQQTSFDKKSFLTYVKGYMKKIKGLLQESAPDQVEIFEKGAQTYIKKVIANFKDYDFYTGESMDPDGMVVLLNYREDGITPYCIFWRHGLTEEKL